MDICDFIEILGADFYTGVPDSQLRALCDYLMDIYGIDEKHHIIAANEGNCVAIAAGYYLSTSKVPVVYMQNSGEGNIINPVVSLLNENIYSIPTIFIIGWRGEPGIHDEPQHIFQGEITCDLLDLLDISYFIVNNETTLNELKEIMEYYEILLKSGKNVAFIISKGALKYKNKIKYENNHSLIREEIIEHIVSKTGDDPIISTTGKASRELFEIRDKLKQTHSHDFLTVGSMGHASSIALGVAINNEEKKIWCIDGDGSVLMHMGSLPVIANICPKNLVHIVINNGAHETVGGMPTSVLNIQISNIAKQCGYKYTVSVDNLEDLDKELSNAKLRNELTLIEVFSSIGSRADLGRPSIKPNDNKKNFMRFLKK